MYRKNKTIDELWAILDENGKVCMSRGGSSSKSKIMVYSDENTAKKALNNVYTKQVIDINKVTIKKIY